MTHQAAASAGSSPLARGLLDPGDRRGIQPGIIPARAGFTWTSMPWRLCSTDHPRSRGVYMKPFSTSRAICGSSPLARGLLDKSLSTRQCLGIIPARAGFTPVRRWGCDDVEDHPRSRGVYEAAGDRTLTASGSSPLARGLPAFPLRPRGTPGIIPARAGFTAYPG